MISRRVIQKRRGQDPDAFMARWCVQPPKPGETEGLFVVGVVLPVQPSGIIGALAAVGVRPAFYRQGRASRSVLAEIKLPARVEVRPLAA